MQIQENPYLQYFCGYPCFDDSKPPFDASLMVHFRKQLTPKNLAEINEMITPEALDDKNDDDNDDNSGTMIVDATCAPPQIRYPQDASLLSEARETAEKLVDLLHNPADGKKTRTY